MTVGYAPARTDIGAVVDALRTCKVIACEMVDRSLPRDRYDVQFRKFDTAGAYASNTP